MCVWLFPWKLHIASYNGFLSLNKIILFLELYKIRQILLLLSIYSSKKILPFYGLLLFVCLFYKGFLLFISFISRQRKKNHSKEMRWTDFVQTKWCTRALCIALDARVALVHVIDASHNCHPLTASRSLTFLHFFRFCCTNKFNYLLSSITYS